MDSYLRDALLLILFYFLFLYRKWRKQENFLFKTVWYLNICVVFAVTLMTFVFPIFKGNNLYLQSLNLIPFRDIFLRRPDAVQEVLLSVLMMVPYGLLTPMFGKEGLKIIAFKTLAFSLGIECIQLLYSRSGVMTSRIFGVTDFIHIQRISWFPCHVLYPIKECKKEELLWRIEY